MWKQRDVLVLSNTEGTVTVKVLQTFLAAKNQTPFADPINTNISSMYCAGIAQGSTIDKRLHNHSSSTNFGLYILVNYKTGSGDM